MAKKFIINDGQLILGDVEYHSSLLRDNTKTVGGGLWHYDHETETLYLYGSSLDYGPVSKEQIEHAEYASAEGKKIIWSMAPSLAQAIESGQEITIKPNNAF